MDGVDHPLAARDEFNVEDATVSFIQSRLNLNSDAVGFRTSAATDVGQHAFVRQQIVNSFISTLCCRIAYRDTRRAEWYTRCERCRQRRLQQSEQGRLVRVLVRQAEYVAANLLRIGSVLTCATAKIPNSTPSLTLEQAIEKAESALSGKFNQHPATLEFVAKQDGSLALTHVMQVENDETGAWVEAFIDAHTGELVQLTDFVTKITVSVLLCGDGQLSLNEHLRVWRRSTASFPSPRRRCRRASRISRTLRTLLLLQTAGTVTARRRLPLLRASAVSPYCIVDTRAARD